MWSPVVLFRYWLFQGMGYMNWLERLHRLTLEFFFATLVWVLLSQMISGIWCIFWTLFIAHTASMVFNGHLFALFKHDLYWFGFYKHWEDFANYIVKIQLRLNHRPCAGLNRAEIYGSLTRGRFSDSSDLDLRFIAAPGFKNGWLVAHRVFEERLRAFFKGFPMDIYMFHSEDELARKMDLSREKPIVIFQSGQSGEFTSFNEIIQPLRNASND